MGAQIGAWVQVAYNGNTGLINPQRDYVLEADVLSTVQQLIDELTDQSPWPWCDAGSTWRRTVWRGSPQL